MNILICNDDGVYAPGIKVLREFLKEIANVTVVAPLEERSTTGHTLTLDHPLRIVEIEENIFGCSGYPADCSLMGITEIVRHNIPDLVVSGINRGANLGQDIFYSGTVAAAREAAFRDIKAISISSIIDFGSTVITNQEHYETAAEFTRELILSKIYEKLPARSLLNINVPNLPKNKIKGTKASEIGFRYYSEQILKREDFRKREYYWIGGVYEGYDEIPDSDCNIVQENCISVTPIQLVGTMTKKLSEWQKDLDLIKF